MVDQQILIEVFSNFSDLLLFFFFLFTGNILLNIMLLPSMQLKRQGKNNVSLVCIPNPPVSKDSDNKLIPMLLRVKTAEEADELLEELNKHKCGTESDAAEWFAFTSLTEAIGKSH